LTSFRKGVHINVKDVGRISGHCKRPCKKKKHPDALDNPANRGDTKAYPGRGHRDALIKANAMPTRRIGVIVVKEGSGNLLQLHSRVNFDSQGMFSVSLARLKRESK
jgi:hypothetical protein